MSFARDIIVRYRAAGHVRFQVPRELCDLPHRQWLVTRLLGIEGIYRVNLYPRQRKLSIRFIESICDFETLARHLANLIRDLPATSATPSCCAETDHSPAPISGSVSGAGPLRWFREKLAEGRETATAMGIVARRATTGGVAGPWLKESTIIEFLNDALVLFLIKLHWHMITQHWLRQPWRYRYEWLAALYMIYLLVRSRRPKTP